MPGGLVYGLGVTGTAVARALAGRGWSLVLADDRDSPAARALAGELGVAFHPAPGPDVVAALVAGADALVPAPGVPEHHPVVAAALAAGVAVVSELDLADDWEHADAAATGRAPRPFVAVTGTDGKTTVTTMVSAMLAASGRRAVAAGNTEVPLVGALGGDAEVFVVEASSFRLRFAERFRPVVATWLNLSADHLDWHPGIEAYAAAKARVWEHQQAGDLAVANADDPVVMAATSGVAGRLHLFGAGPTCAYAVRSGRLVAPQGLDLVGVGELSRAMPHDVANALAAAATALGAGAGVEAVRHVLRTFEHLHHRVELVAEVAGVRFYDDSKATTPHAVAAAVGAFDSVVLIAGGRNKGLDLRPMAAAADRVRAVVAIGEASGDVAAAFGGVRPVVVAASMDEAVAAAAATARPGDAVVLSPGCASFDWYRNYAERGEDFARAVRALGARP